MNFTIFTADCKGNAKNCVYPNRKEITSAEELLSAIATDQVFAEYSNNRRAKANFIASDCIAMDCDNTASDNPADWETLDSMSAKFSEFDFCMFPSRNHMKVKNGKAARPKFHILFPCRQFTDEKEYAAMKKTVYDMFPFFDGNAIDTAHFFYGSDCMISDIIWHDAGSTIDTLISVMNKPHIYHKGERNNAMSRFAARVLKRYGQCDRAFELFTAEAAKCEPPLDDDELGAVWKSAVKFYTEKIMKSSDYVPPEEYNAEALHYKPSDYTDVGQARALAEEYSDELLFTTATDMLRYNGVYWEESKPKALKAVMEFTDLQLDEAGRALDAALSQQEFSDFSREELITGGKRFQSKLSQEQLECLARVETAQRYYSHVMKRRDVKYLLAALTAVKPLVECRVQDLDADAFLFNTPSYTIDLRRGVDGAREHDPNDRITKVTAFDPSDRGKDLWERALQTIFCGDDELIRYVQMICGLAAIGKVYVEALIIAYGEGHNGKSTFWNTILQVHGTYSGSISAEALTVGCKRNVKPELAEVKGKRFIVAAELEEGMRLNTSIVKQLCSTDMFFCREEI